MRFSMLPLPPHRLAFISPSLFHSQLLFYLLPLLLLSFPSHYHLCPCSLLLRHQPFLTPCCLRPLIVFLSSVLHFFLLLHCFLSLAIHGLPHHYPCSPHADSIRFPYIVFCTQTSVFFTASALLQHFTIFLSLSIPFRSFTYPQSLQFSSSSSMDGTYSLLHCLLPYYIASLPSPKLYLLLASSPVSLTLFLLPHRPSLTQHALLS